MRPIVIVKDADGGVKITVDEIKKMVDEAYNAGYEDGRKVVPVASPCVPTPVPLPWHDRDNIVLTCESLPTYL